VLAGEAAFLLPWIWLGLIVELVRGLRAGPASPAWLPCWLAIIPIILFAVVALWSRNVLFHWAMPGYLFLCPLLGARLAAWRPRIARRWAIGTASLLAVASLSPSARCMNWSPRAPGSIPACRPSTSRRSARLCRARPARPSARRSLLERYRQDRLRAWPCHGSALPEPGCPTIRLSQPRHPD
jgi:hypothetical protein